MPKSANSPGYEQHKAAMAQRSRERSAAGRDIGEIPEVANPERREACRLDLARFLKTYLPERFDLAWCKDHLEVIGVLEQAIRDGGLFAMAMPRGSGKTAICEGAVIYAILYGYHPFVVLSSATTEMATHSLEKIKTALETYEELYEDFPEAIHPIRSLEGTPQKCKGQLYQGKRTHIGWHNRSIVFPVIPGSRSAESIIRVAGITAATRGMAYQRRDKALVRPTLVIADDPQTDESAMSKNQVNRRIRILNGALLKLAGPKKKISAVCPCTCIQKDDVADQLLNREKSPLWRGLRCRFVLQMPTGASMKMWEQYSVLRKDSYRNGGKGEEATEFYRRHREQMDAGFEVSWPERFNHDEISAQQRAMNEFFDDPEGFFSEYQNDPLGSEKVTAGDLKPEMILGRINGRPAGVVPSWATRITAFTDVQSRVLYQMVCAWGEDFTGAVIEYGVWPKQGRRYFTYADALKTFEDLWPTVGEDGRIRAALDQWVSPLAQREFVREDGVPMRADRVLVDSGKWTDVIYEYCRSAGHQSIRPSKGRYVGAKNRQWSEFKVQAGERPGHHCLERAIEGKQIRLFEIDTNYWKTYISQRITQAIGDPGAISLHDGDHTLLADHWTAEYSQVIAAVQSGIEVREWALKPGRPDNHWWDCLVGCAAAASFEGVGGNQPIKRKRRVLTADEWRKMKFGA